MKIEKRTLTPAEWADQLRGSTRVAPGIWFDRQGGLHFAIPEILAAVGLDNTPENQAIARDVVREFVEELGGEDRPVVEQELEDRTNRPQG